MPTIYLCPGGFAMFASLILDTSNCLKCIVFFNDLFWGFLDRIVKGDRKWAGERLGVGSGNGRQSDSTFRPIHGRGCCLHHSSPFSALFDTNVIIIIRVIINYNINYLRMLFWTSGTSLSDVRTFCYRSTWAPALNIRLNLFYNNL